MERDYLCFVNKSCSIVFAKCNLPIVLETVVFFFLKLYQMNVRRKYKFIGVVFRGKGRFCLNLNFKDEK